MSVCFKCQPQGLMKVLVFLQPALFPSVVFVMCRKEGLANMEANRTFSLLLQQKLIQVPAKERFSCPTRMFCAQTTATGRYCGHCDFQHQAQVAERAKVTEDPERTGALNCSSTAWFTETTWTAYWGQWLWQTWDLLWAQPVVHSATVPQYRWARPVLELTFVSSQCNFQGDKTALWLLESLEGWLNFSLSPVTELKNLCHSNWAEKRVPWMSDTDTMLEMSIPLAHPTCSFSDTDSLLRVRISGFLAVPRAEPLGK